MAFNIAAAIGGAAEEVARGMNERQARLISLTDEAWSDHKTQFQKKRDAEETKAEMYEETIKSIAGLEGVDSIDEAAAIYAKLGTDEQARDWVQGAQTLTSYGGNLKEMGYISGLPDDFEATDMTAAEYAKSFTDSVRFGEGLGEGTRVAGRLQTRYDQMSEMGLAPKDYTPTQVNYAEISVDPSLRGSQISIAASREMLTTQLSRLDADSPQAAAVQKSLDALNDAEMKALGGKIDSDSQLKAERLYRRIITSKAVVMGAEKTGMDITTDSTGNRTYTVNNSKIYGSWVASQIPTILKQQKELLPAKEYQALEAYLNGVLADNEAKATAENVDPELSSKAVPKGSVKQVDTNLLKTQIMADIAAGISYEDAKAEAIADGVDEALFDQIYAETQGQGALIGAGQ